jgi:beta-lactamase regulating signal transducer with metallopeptidase domain
MSIMALPGITIKVSLIIMFALAATVLLRKQSAALRHWVLAAAIVCAAATPLFTLVVPSWGVRPAESSSGGLTLASDPDSDSYAASGFSRTTSGRNPAEAGSRVRVLISVWIAGAAIGVGVLLVGLARLAWLASKSRPVHAGAWRDLADEVSRRFGLRRPVLLLQSDHPALLVTWGLVRPKVILPRAAREWSEDRVRIVLCHELAHIRRGDWVVQIAAQLVRSVYWFNPLLWMACARLRLESEQACDDRVLNLGVERTEYATQLLDLARTFRKHGRTPSLGSPAPAIAHPSTLERRIRAMLNAHLNRTPLTRSTSVVIAAALLVMTASIAGFGAAQSAAASFSGALMDAIGRTLPDAPLALVNTQSRARHELRSDQAGHFEFAGLPAGDYQLETKLPGFSGDQGRVTLGAGQNLRQDVVFQVGSLQETITTTGPDAGLVSGVAGDASGASRESRKAFAEPKPDPCSQSTAGGCITQPRKIRDVKPRYPRQLWEAGIGGIIKLEGRIGTDGFLKDLRVMAPADPDLALAATEAVGQWQYSQTRLDGVPIEVRLNISVNFRP